MKYFTLVTCLFCLTFLNLNSQVTNISIEVDQTFVAPLPDVDLTGYTVYSVYANFTNPDDFVSAIYGIFNEPENIIVTFDCACFNSDVAGFIGPDNNSLFWPVAPSAEFDSYLTIGQESSQDPGQTQFISSAPPTAVAVNSFEDNCSLNVDDGALFTTYPQPNGFAGNDLKVKIAQFTTCGNFCFDFGIQVFVDGDQFNEERTMWSICSDLCALNPIDDSITLLADFGCNGDEALIGFGAGGNGTLTYELYDDNNGSPILIDTQVDNPTFSVSQSGDYFAIITDIAGCTATTPILSLDEPEPLELVVDSFTDLLCAGLNNGEICVTASGGTPPYAIIATLPNNSTTNLSNPGCVSGLSCSGNNNVVTITVTDAFGCAAEVEVTLSCPTALDFEVTSEDLSCNGSNDGAFGVVVSGGSGPYDALVNGPGLNQNLNDFNSSFGFTDLGAGNFNFTITDSNGCEIDGSVQVDQPTAVQVSATAGELDCSDSCDGTITSTPSGGTGPYTTSILLNGQPATNGQLCAGDYVVQVLDSNNCPASDDVEVIAPDPITASTLPADSICVTDCSGVLCAVVLSGGTGDFEYSLSGEVQDDPCFDGLCVGTYTIQITDENDCSVSVSGYVPEVTDPSHPLYVVCNPELTFPNIFSPNDDDVNEFYIIDGLEAYPNSSLQIFNRWGNIVFESDDYKNNWDAKDASEGTYFYTFKTERYGEKNGHITIVR
jgi:gliding motility-associated-like protein